MKHKLKVLLINPPSPFLENALCEPPLGLLYIAGAVEQYCASYVETTIVDLGDDDNYLASLTNILGPQRFDIVGITGVTPQYPYMMRTAEVVRSFNPHTLIVMGGPHATWAPESLNGLADIIVKGEGERAFLDIITAYRGGNINVAALNESPCVLANRYDHPQMDFPAWYPARQKIALKDYSRHVGGVHATTMITSRGCPAACRYCAKTWKKCKLYPAWYVIRELWDIKYIHGFNALLFVDDTFTYDPDRLNKICREIRSLEMVFRCWTRADYVQEDTLKMMAASGCKEISFGIESGSQKLLDAMNKGTTVEQNKNALKWAKAAGIKTKAFLMIGIPGETEETVEETKRLIDETDPDEFILSTFTPIVGSYVWRHPEQFGINNLSVISDYSHQWEVGKSAKGGVYIDTDLLSSQRLKDLHGDLLSYLRERKDG